MNSSTFVKQEPLELELIPTSHLFDSSSNVIGSAFDTYINTNYVDDSPGSNSNHVPGPAINFDLDVSNSEMMCYFMDSDLVSTTNGNTGSNHSDPTALTSGRPLDSMLEPQDNVGYMGSHLPYTYQPHPFMESSSLAPSVVSAVPDRKKKNHQGTRKPSTKSNHSDSNGEPTYRSDLVLSPEELDLIARANPKERRQIRNKISARNFRLRRKEYVNELEVRAMRFDEEVAMLHETILHNQSETKHLQQCIDDLLKKFALLTTTCSGLQQFKGLDPLTDMTFTSDGRLTNSSSAESHLTCREVSTFEATNSGSELLSDDTLTPLFSSSRERALMVKA